MKSELKAKLLQHLISKKRDGGFTLIELLVVIIIIGILASIALPSFLNQANKAKQSEAKTYVGSMNRAQQAYYLEKNAFAADITTLGLGVSSSTTNYKYSISAATASVGNLATPTTGGPLRAYSGGVGLVTPTGASETTTLAILCEAGTAGTALTTASYSIVAAGASCVSPAIAVK